MEAVARASWRRGAWAGISGHPAPTTPSQPGAAQQALRGAPAPTKPHAAGCSQRGRLCVLAASRARGSAPRRRRAHHQPQQSARSATGRRGGGRRALAVAVRLAIALGLIWTAARARRLQAHAHLDYAGLGQLQPGTGGGKAGRCAGDSASSSPRLSRQEDGWQQPALAPLKPRRDGAGACAPAGVVAPAVQQQRQPCTTETTHAHARRLRRCRRCYPTTHTPAVAVAHYQQALAAASDVSSPGMSPRSACSTPGEIGRAHV